MSKKGGYYCAFKDCRGLSRRDKRSFFRFPKDPQRSKEWVRACNRNDLLEKTPLELFNGYRVCAKHFTDSMFLNDLRNRLQPNSIPMQLECLESFDDDLQDVKKRSHFADSQNPVAKILSNCILEKISADEFFKATGICCNEPVSAVKTTEEYLKNSNPSDNIYSSTKANNLLSDNGNILTINIDTGNPNNSFSDKAFRYQDLMNPLCLPLISGTNIESSLETSQLSFMIVDKTDRAIKIPESVLEGLDMASYRNLSQISKKMEEGTQTDLILKGNKLEKGAQTKLNFFSNNFKKQFDSKKIQNEVDKSNQTEICFLKHKLIKKKFKKSLQIKNHKIKELKHKIQQNFINAIDNITLDQYDLLTEKFFPKVTSNFIKIQARLFKKRTNDRKYSLEFKKQCLSLFLTDSNTYKNLQKIFCLPETCDLQNLKF